MVDDHTSTNSSVMSQTTTAVRYLVSAFGGYLVAQGLISGDTAELMAAVAATATPMLIGMALTRAHQRQLKEANEIADKVKQSNVD